jgi:hypothetical protein
MTYLYFGIHVAALENQIFLKFNITQVGTFRSYEIRTVTRKEQVHLKRMQIRISGKRGKTFLRNDYTFPLIRGGLFHV